MSMEARLERLERGIPCGCAGARIEPVYIGRPEDLGGDTPDDARPRCPECRRPLYIVVRYVTNWRPRHEEIEI